MTVVLPAPRTSLSEFLHAVTQVLRGEDRSHGLVTALQIARLVPAVFVPGIERQNAAAIVAAGLPEVTYRRRTLHRRLDEHLFLDIGAGTGVRVMACWDDRAYRVRMHVAEIGESLLWERIVVHFTEWERAGRPVPAASCTRRPGRRD
ncbi:hypothetical protein [Amycolatopsis sp. CA-126428]|uniref:hypothetical protein n=1 Tax=Amycolatopsis sp. CA-126428 TaxID=2073158 RepID=UPI000CD22CAA|nr:hypothetical protein [Amycolatopsis sp. CA-126428]